MDCMHVSEIISAARDGEHVPAGSVAHAREHCGRCPECAALLATVVRMKNTPQARAPEQLITRILETVREEEAARSAAEAADDTATPTTGDTLPLGSPDTRRRGVPTWWQPRFTAIASAAVVVITVGTLSTYMLVQVTRPVEQTATADYAAEIATPGHSMEEAQEDSALERDQDVASATTSGSTQDAPSFVVWDGTVWMRADGPTPDASTLSAAGVIMSDLGESGGSKSREVLTGAADPKVIFVRASDESLIRFAQTTRTLDSRPYALTASTPVTTFGSWPTLPPRYPTPTTEDGAPVFTPDGLDDHGREVFVPTGADARAGFAVAPGTPPGDPAAGNPNWTWWEPID